MSRNNNPCRSVCVLLKVNIPYTAQKEGELSCECDRTLEIIRDVGNGWSECLNNDGERGLFPTNHGDVIMLESKPPLIVGTQSNGNPFGSCSIIADSNNGTKVVRPPQSSRRAKTYERALEEEEDAMRGYTPYPESPRSSESPMEPDHSGSTDSAIYSRSISGSESIGSRKSISLTECVRSRKGSTNREIDFSRLEKGRMLGKGSFGSVYVWTDKTTGEMIAGKEIGINCVDESAVLLQEGIKISKLDHPNIVWCFNLHLDGEKLYLFTELMKISIKDLVKKRPLTENEAKAVTSDILEGIIYLHDQDMIHRDIKGENILLDEKSVAKIGDFGLSRWFFGRSTLPDVSQLQGTLLYLAPELFDGAAQGKRSDIWSIGCTVYEMLIGNPPLYGGDMCIRTIMARTASLEQATLAEKLIAGTQLKDFLRSIFVRLENRPYAPALKSHEWMKGPTDRVDLS